MKILIVEDDFASRVLLQEYLRTFGVSHIAVTGKEAVAAVTAALAAREPYELICLDIMMPDMDGQIALREIRRIEADAGVSEDKRARIVMTTALADADNVIAARDRGCDAYLVKPFKRERLLQELRTLKLI